MAESAVGGALAIEKRRAERRLLMRPNSCRKKSAEAAGMRKRADGNQLASADGVAVPDEEEMRRTMLGDMPCSGKREAGLEEDVRLEALAGETLPFGGMRGGRLRAQCFDRQWRCILDEACSCDGSGQRHLLIGHEYMHLLASRHRGGWRRLRRIVLEGWDQPEHGRPLEQEFEPRSSHQRMHEKRHAHAGECHDHGGEAHVGDEPIMQDRGTGRRHGRERMPDR